MKLMEYFALNAVTGMALLVLAVIPLVTDLIAATSYTAGEVFGGIFMLCFLFYTVVMIFSWR